MDQNTDAPQIQTQQVVDSSQPLVLHAVSVKNKVGFINGEVQKLAVNSSTFAQWERCDDMVTSWILNSLLKDLVDSLQYVNNAKELWEELQDRYDQTNGAKLYQLQREINDLAQGNMDITGYYPMLRRLWEDFNTLDPNTQCTCLCNCGGKTKMHKAKQDRKLIHAREKQREFKPSTRMSLASTSLSASSGASTSLSASSGSGNFRTNYSHNKHTNGNNVYRGPSKHFQHVNRNTYRIPAINKTNWFCDYCKKVVHTEDKCYRLNGFPQNFKCTRGRNSGSAATAHTTCEVPMDHVKGTQSLTKDQYDHLVRLLEYVQVQGPSSSTKDTVDNIMSGVLDN
ncbi:hypothetical protein KY290_012498 [Solanum tuberosum]|uniref:Retrotransposon gag domain-containing protein n=1 Tax=Solanum tuberosum TaxID=4113 RepID=A0ABQ7W3K5_SOLTU|nr:hypothetical protein KY284_010398 [Solanum tuberosum]KAH0775361.1 hypothetical protein KY290_012498 [Solanum tuberosum]